MARPEWQKGRKKADACAKISGVVWRNAGIAVQADPGLPPLERWQPSGIAFGLYGGTRAIGGLDLD